MFIDKYDILWVMRIEKKVWKEYFQRILDGKKTFELRLADFACHGGDTLVLKEWDEVNKAYTEREIEKRVTYVLKTRDVPFRTKEDIDKYGLQMISFT